MPFDPEIPQVGPEPQHDPMTAEPFDVALKKLIEALGEAPAAQALVESGASPREAVQAVQAVAPAATTQDVLSEMRARRGRQIGPPAHVLPEPVVAPWLTNQLEDVRDGGTGGRFPSGVFEPSG